MAIKLKMKLKMRMRIKPTIGAENEAKITTVLNANQRYRWSARGARCLSCKKK